MSSQKSKSLWVICGGLSIKLGPEHASFSCCAYSIGISASFQPCTINVGHCTLGIRLRLSNWFAIRKLKNPTLLVAMCLIDVSGDIRISPPGLNLDAKYVAGPLPRERPRIIMSYCLRLVFLITNRYASSASAQIYCSDGPLGSV